MIYKERNCTICNTKFKPSHSKQVCCSIDCFFTNKQTIDLNKLDDNCINWEGCKDSPGYGVFKFENKMHKAHRFMCTKVHGPEPEGKPYVLHSCDNPSCVNPNHLRWGSHQENVDDKVNRYRCKTLLTKEQVIEIIDKLKNYKRGDLKDIAKLYNVKPHIIEHIYANKSWKQIPR